MKSRYSAVFFLAAIVVLGTAGAGAARQLQGGRISIAEPRFDAGTVAAGTRLEHTFEIRNTGDEVLEIQSVRPS